MDHVAMDAEQAIPATSAAGARARLLFVDNIRVFLTVVVIMHHLMITYAGTGGWIYREERQDAVTDALGSWFCAVDQAYFMGLFLLISAYFVPGSYDRKGPGRFTKDRLVRLGIPLAVFCWVVNPLFLWWFLGASATMSYWTYLTTQYFSGWRILGQGPLWFVELLLIFSLFYVVWRVLGQPGPQPTVTARPFPRDRALVIFALGLGVAAWLVRVAFPMDAYTFAPLNLQFGFFASYVALFVVGLLAYRHDWLRGMPDRTGRRWLVVAAAFVVLWAPLVLALGAADDDAPLKGGLRWQAGAYALWEAFMCVSMCIAVIYFFRRHLDRRGRLAAFLVPNAYTAYLIHAPVIATLAYELRGLTWYPLLKWALVCVVAVPLCFCLSALIRKIPYTDRAL